MLKHFKQSFFLIVLTAAALAGFSLLGAVVNQKVLVLAELFGVDPAGLAPAALRVKSRILLHKIRARVRFYFITKKPLKQEELFRDTQNETRTMDLLLITDIIAKPFLDVKADFPSLVRGRVPYRKLSKVCPLENIILYAARKTTI